MFRFSIDKNQIDMCFVISFNWYLSEMMSYISGFSNPRITT